MDSTAFSLCMDNKMPIIVFDFFRRTIFKRVVWARHGEKVGTLVTSPISPIFLCVLCVLLRLNSPQNLDSFAMPELPEVEVLARHLRPLLRGRTIRGVTVRRPKVLRPTTVGANSKRFCAAQISRPHAARQISAV
jgi:hypothetical protein